MRVMALDYGDKRTGVAVSDSLRILVGDTFTLREENSRKLAEIIAGEAAGRAVDTVVLGFPRNMNGSEGPRAEKTRRFKTLLEAQGLSVILLDERRTTVEADRILSETGNFGAKRKQKVDAVAASLILEGYLQSEALR